MGRILLRRTSGNSSSVGPSGKVKTKSKTVITGKLPERLSCAIDNMVIAQKSEAILIGLVHSKSGIIGISKFRWYRIKNLEPAISSSKPNKEVINIASQFFSYLKGLTYLSEDEACSLKFLERCQSSLNSSNSINKINRVGLLEYTA